MRRASIWIGAGVIAFVAAIAVTRLGWDRRPAPAGRGPDLEPKGTSGLDSTRWVATSEGDFEESVVDQAADGSRLRIRAATRGTRDDTVKFLGARSARSFKVGPESRISARLDWNKQENGCYLSAGVVLSPQATKGNPLSGLDWVKVEYIGVPPGDNARLLISCKREGRERFLHTEGWPDKNRSGRRISLEKIELLVLNGAIKVFENGSLVYESKERVVGFDTAHLYLQLSSHSNYPPREVFFDQISVPDGL
jgi:hypothetical protein